MSCKCHWLWWDNYQVWNEGNRFEEQLTPLTSRQGKRIRRLWEQWMSRSWDCQHWEGVARNPPTNSKPTRGWGKEGALAASACTSSQIPDQSTHTVFIFSNSPVPCCSCQLQAMLQPRSPPKTSRSHVMSDSPTEKCDIQTAVEGTLYKITRSNPHRSLIYTGERH